MNSKLIYIVDDEPDILELVDLHLQKSGFITKTFEDTVDLINTIRERMPDLLILDLMLPFTDGLEICKTLRNDDELNRIPIIMLTAKGDETDKVLGLEMGADDYISKPFSPRELVARVKAVLRRSESLEPQGVLIKVGTNMLIDTKRFIVKIGGNPVNLTNTEIKILKLLTSRKGWVFSREQILNHLWGHDKIVIDRTIDVHINHLRKKLGEAGKYIHNVRGIGYKIDEN